MNYKKKKQLFLVGMDLFENKKNYKSCTQCHNLHELCRLYEGVEKILLFLSTP